MPSNAPISAGSLTPYLRTRLFGRSLTCLDTTGSTNEVASRLAASGAVHGHVVIADQQSAGRGRRGRSWESPPGRNLYLSLILRPELPPPRAAELTLVAAVATCEAVRAAGGAARIKWPNDVQIDGRKVCGILMELSARPEQIEHIVLGVGVNLNLDAAEFPEELRPIATSLREARSGEPVDRDAFAADLLLSLERWCERHIAEGFEPVRERWLELSGMIGRRIRVRLENREFEGEARGIDASGALLVTTESGTERVIAGDVESVRPAR